MLATVLVTAAMPVAIAAAPTAALRTGIVPTAPASVLSPTSPTATTVPSTARVAENLVAVADDNSDAPHAPTVSGPGELSTRPIDDVSSVNSLLPSSIEVGPDVHASVAPTTYKGAERIVSKLKPPRAKKRLRTLVIRVHWRGNKKDKSTTKQFRTLAKRADLALRAASRGRYGVAMTTTPWLAISRTSCSDYSGLAAKATAAANRKGGAYRTSRYSRVVVYIKGQSQCPWAGLAQVRGNTIWLNGSRHTMVLVHEIAHTFGAGHSNYRTCSKSRTLTAGAKGCHTYEYGDIGDLMGAGPTTGHAQGMISRDIGWLAASQSTSVKKRRATVKLTPRSSTGRGLKAARVRGKSNTYWVEYRTRTGLDKVLTKDLTGVVINVSTRGLGTTSAILDLQPQNDYYAVSLPVGSSWTSPDRVRFTVTKQTKSRATVKIDRKASASRAPAKPRTPRVSAGDMAARVVLTKGNDRGAPIQKWQVRAVPVGGGKTIKGAMAATAAKSRTAMLQNLTNGASYRVSVRVYNERGWSKYSAPATVKPVPIAPTVQVISPTNNQLVQGSIPINVVGRIKAGSTAVVTNVTAYLDVPWSTNSAWLSQSGGAKSLTLRSNWALQDLPDGQYAMRFVVTDSAGRTSVVARTIRVTGQSPTVTVDSADIAGNTLTVKFTPREHVNAIGGVMVVVVRQSTGLPVNTLSYDPVNSGEQYQWTFNMSAQPAGEYLVDVIIADESNYFATGTEYPFSPSWGINRATKTVTW